MYNTENIARVRRDEAAAKAREEEEERRMQEVDAERRIQLLRGSDAPSTALLEDRHDIIESERDKRPGRKRKRRYGEDDTDRDIRLAREDARELAISERSNAMALHKSAHEAPLIDQNGHISLFPEGRKRPHHEKNAEAEAEAAKKKRELEDQYTMRFSNAAGYKQGMANPWYASPGENGSTEKSTADKDMWGNDGYRRQERQKARIQDEDPLSSMRRGVQEVKKVERERTLWIADREKELRELKRMERKSRQKTSRRHRHRRLEDDIEPLDLDGLTRPRDVGNQSSEAGDRHRSRREHHHQDYDARKRDYFGSGKDRGDREKTSN